MAKLSENEILEKCKDYENWKVVYNPGGVYQFIPLSEGYKQAIERFIRFI